MNLDFVRYHRCGKTPPLKPRLRRFVWVRPMETAGRFPPWKISRVRESQISFEYSTRLIVPPHHHPHTHTDLLPALASEVCRTVPPNNMAALDICIGNISLSLSPSVVFELQSPIMTLQSNLPTAFGANNHSSPPSTQPD